jgi:hypothetical protein
MMGYDSLPSGLPPPPRSPSQQSCPSTSATARLHDALTTASLGHPFAGENQRFSGVRSSIHDALGKGASESDTLAATMVAMPTVDSATDSAIDTAEDAAALPMDAVDDTATSVAEDVALKAASAAEEVASKAASAAEVVMIMEASAAEDAAAVAAPMAAVAPDTTPERKLRFRTW